MKRLIIIFFFAVTILPQTRVEDINTFTLKNGMKIIQFQKQAYLSSIVFFNNLPFWFTNPKKYRKFGCLNDAINVNSVS